ncbi:MAG: GerMN domain-containing protein [Desulfotomaculum sp.]|nr:GerMN domain-containing protein [Desulfotomaculum sp.]
MYKKMQRFFVILGLLLIMGCLGACSEEGEEEATVTINQVSQPEEQVPAEEDVVVLQDVMDKIPVVLYFADELGCLVAQQREIPKVDGIARVTMQELAKGPDPQSGLLPTLPPGTHLKDINIKDGVCIVDMSRELKENHAGGSSGEMLTVYSIVNTLTQFPTVERVKILVNGQVVNTLAGHVDLSVPLGRNDSIITSSQ